MYASKPCKIVNGISVLCGDFRRGCQSGVSFSTIDMQVTTTHSVDDAAWRVQIQALTFGVDILTSKRLKSQLQL